MTTIGNNMKAVTDYLMGETGIKWTSQLTSRGFILYRKPKNDDETVAEYNTWRDICCGVLGVTYEDLDNDSKKGSEVEPRHWCWYMMVAVSYIDIEAIVTLLNGQKNRTSILHAIRKIHSYLYRIRPEEKACKTFDRLVEAYLEFKKSNQ